MLKFLKVSALLPSLLAFFPVVSQAQGCQTTTIPATTPSNQFIDNADGTVTDTKTTLMWKRCSEGQYWNNVTCTGNATGYDWHAALLRAQTVNSGGGFAGRVGWRVPNIKELRSITEKQCVLPAINLLIFPRTVATLLDPDSTETLVFWSSSPVAGQVDDPWTVNFKYGTDYGAFADDLFMLRLVRDAL